MAGHYNLLFVKLNNQHLFSTGNQKVST